MRFCRAQPNVLAFIVVIGEFMSCRFSTSKGRCRNPKFESDMEVHTVVLLGKHEQVVGQR